MYGRDFGDCLCDLLRVSKTWLPLRTLRWNDRVDRGRGDVLVVRKRVAILGNSPYQPERASVRFIYVSQVKTIGIETVC